MRLHPATPMAPEPRPGCSTMPATFGRDELARDLGAISYVAKHNDTAAELFAGQFGSISPGSMNRIDESVRRALSRHCAFAVFSQQRDVRNGVLIGFCQKAIVCLMLGPVTVARDIGDYIANAAHESMPPPDQVGDQTRPSGLVASPEASPVVSIEVL